MNVYISKNANKELVSYLVGKGLNISFVDKHANVSDAVSCHPDIYYCQLPSLGLYEGDANLLNPEYPGDVLYNAAFLGKYFICSKYTSKDLLDTCTIKYGLSPIIVPQGYVKCNLCIVDDNHVITEDEGIFKTLRNSDISCLLIEKGHVLLPGYPYGFIGGASGRVGSEIIFNGDISAHPSYKKIASFISSCDLSIKYFDSYSLTDIGSILLSNHN